MKQPDHLSAVSSKFALVTNIGTAVHVPNAPVADPVPGVMLGLETLPTNGGESSLICGSLIGGSSATPVAVFATVIGKQSIILLANPLDPSLRSSMQAQRDAEKIPLQAFARDGTSVRATPSIPVWEVALADTKGRPFVDPEVWLTAAQAYAPVVPAVLAQKHPELKACREHHVFMLVPEDPDHPLYKVLQRHT